MSAKGRSVETRLVEGVEACAKALAAMADTNRRHFELARQATAKSETAHAEQKVLQDESIRRSTEMHDALMERHAQVSEAHELMMAAAGARAPDYMPSVTEPKEQT